MKLKLTFGILLFVCMVEIFTRVVLFRSSKDLRRFQTYPAKIQNLKNEKSRVVLIGNSLTERGLNPDILKQELNTTVPGDFFVDMFVADASKINVWYYMVNQYFWKENLNPELFVISFYEGNLADGNSLELGRLAQFFTRREDWSEVFRFDIQDTGQQLEFGVSSVWATYAVRDRIRERVLGGLVPHFKDVTEEVNSVNVRMHRRGKVDKPVAARTYLTLKRLLERGKQKNNRFCFVAFPTISNGKRSEYPIDPELVALIKAYGMEFIDMRHFPELDASYYADDIHLTPEGAAIYTKKFSKELRAILAPSPEGNRRPT